MTKLPPAARMSSNVFPPSKLTSNTPPSNPRFGSTSDASRLKLCRKVNCAEAAARGKCSESSRLSLRTAGSSMNAALGGVSAGGFGIPLFDVTQSGGGPKALVASQSDGNTGGVTLSKFSSNTTGKEQGPHEGLGSGVAPMASERSTPPRPVSSGEADPAWLIAREEPIGTNAPTPAPINKVTQSTFRRRLSLNERALDFPS